MELTEKEEEWIKELQRVCKKHPKTLWLFNDGTMNVMKYNAEGNVEITPSGGMNPDYCVGTIMGIYSDGGDW